MLPGFVYFPGGSVDDDRLYLRNRVTDVYPRGEDVPSPALALIVQDDAVDALGLLERSGIVSTFGRRIAISAIEFVTPVSVQRLVDQLPGRVRRHGRAALLGGGPVSPETWAALRTVLARYPEIAAQVERLDRRTSPPGWAVSRTDRRAETVQMEHDAVGLALSLGGLDRGALNSWTAADEPAPFLEGLDSLELREDNLLINDMLVFGDWDRTNANGLWSEFADRGRRVTVMNVNRTTLERTLGVDLIYYSHRHQAFTIVQYKRMRVESDSSSSARPVYRPAHDKNLARQIDRMRKLESGTIPAPTTMNEYRLGGPASFLKVCRPEMLLGTADLSRGMYIDLNLWELVLAEITADGGAEAIRPDSPIRYLNNTDFISLVRGGWIGSRGLTTKKIARYITRALSSRHSVTLAAAEDAEDDDEDDLI